MRASSLFPILSVGLLFLGGVCVAASEFYKSRYNVILSAGILFVSAGQEQKIPHAYSFIISISCSVCHHHSFLLSISPLQVSVTSLASSCTYQPTQVTPARVTTRRATPTAGLFISGLCPLFWLRWLACWRFTCSLRSTDSCAQKAGLPSLSRPFPAAHLTTETVTTTRIAAVGTVTGATTVEQTRPHTPFEHP